MSMVALDRSFLRIAGAAGDPDSSSTLCLDADAASFVPNSSRTRTEIVVVFDLRRFYLVGPEQTHPEGEFPLNV